MRVKPTTACKPLRSHADHTIALVQSGLCTIATKAKNAASAGYLAMVLVEGKKKNKVDAKSSRTHFDIPVIRIKSDDAKALAESSERVTISLQRLRTSPVTGQMVDAQGLAAIGNMYKNDCRHSCWRENGCPGQQQDSAECYQAMVDDQLHMCYDDCGVMTSECYNLCVQKNMVEEHFRMAIDADPRFIDAHYLLCDYQFETGQMDEARKTLEHVFERDGLTSHLPVTNRCALSVIPAASKDRKLRLVTVGNREWPELDILRKTVEAAMRLTESGNADAETAGSVDSDTETAAVSSRLEVLGMGKPYPGHAFKIREMMIYIETVPDDDLVLFTDAYDVLYLSPAGNITALFDSFCAPLVFNAELAVAPDKCMQAILPQPAPHHKLPYFNCGAFMGKAVDVRRMFKEIREDIARNFEPSAARPTPDESATSQPKDIGKTVGKEAAGIDAKVESTENAAWLTVNDQRWFWRYYLAHPEMIALDVEGRMFHTLHGVPADQLLEVQGAPGTFLSNVTGTMPAVLHGNGMGKLALRELVARLEAQGWISPTNQTRTYVSEASY